MLRRWVPGLVLAMFFGGAALGAVAAARADETISGLIPETMAKRHGLTRAWFTQVDMNASKARLTKVSLFPGLIVAQTDMGTVQAIEAETGRTLWTQQFGKRNWPTMRAGANEQFVAVVNGTTLYVVDRNDGDLKWSRSLGASPAAGVTLAGGAAYIPMRSHSVESFKLAAPQRFPQKYSSTGETDVTPLVTHESIVWPTERGILYVVPFGGEQPRFSIELRGAMVAAPSFNPPVLFAGTLDGFLYAIDEFRGQILWRYLVGGPVRQTPVVIGNGVYTIPEQGGMFRINADSGLEDWWTPEVTQFLSASKARVYVKDLIGRLAIIDAASGSVLSTLPANGYNLSPSNTANDRIILADEKGLIQSLREIELTQTVEHIPPKPTQVRIPQPIAPKPEADILEPAAP